MIFSGSSWAAVATETTVRIRNSLAVSGVREVSGAGSQHQLIRYPVRSRPSLRERIDDVGFG